MGILDAFKKKKKEKTILPPKELPSDLEELRIKRKPEMSLPGEGPVQRQASGEVPVIPEKQFLPSEYTPPSGPGGGDKLDLILSKLETIDARLRLLEERVKG